MRTLRSLLCHVASSPNYILGLSVHVLIAVWFISLIVLPEGTPIRYLGWLVDSISLNSVTFPVALLLAIYDWRAGKKAVAICGFFLCSSIYLAAIGYFILFSILRSILLPG